MSRLLLLLFAFPFIANSQITTYNAGQAFTCITVDSNYNVWAGTSKAGLYLLNKKDNPTAKQFAITSSGNLSTYNIQTLAADQNKNVWVGHNGLGSTVGGNASGGGIEQINMNTTSVIKHYSPDANAECLKFVARDGLATLNSASIAIDKNGTVWSAHKYHDLFVEGTIPDIILGIPTGGSPAHYIVTPGALSYKFASQRSFISKGTYEDYRIGADPELAYPAYTCDAPISKTPGSRNTYAVACGNNEVWLSVAPYEAKNGIYYPARLFRYNLAGRFIGSFDYRSIGIPANFVFNGIYITPQGKVWVTMTQGRVLYFDGSYWHTITSFPASLVANYNAITGDKFGNVYIGTNGGLVVCSSNPLSTKSSFTVYTTAHGLPSSNIKGVAAERNGSIWLATDKGVSKFSPSSFAVYNLINPIRNEEVNLDKLINEINGEKFRIVAANDRDTQINGKPIEINVAADSSNATLIVYTGASPETKEISLINVRGDNDPYVPETGKFKVIVRSKDSLVYLYRHPNYVSAGNSEKFVTYSIALRDKNTGLNVIQGKLNIYHPPVLMVHGVWSSIEALGDMKKYLVDKSSNYENYQVLPVWYSTSDHPEPPLSAEYYSNEIPKGISELLLKCRENGLSAGKVNVVGHSRGGLFARYYLQSTFPDHPYRNDINSLITINTPHLGAQTANLILDKRKILGLVEVGSLFKFAMLSNPKRPEGDDPNGAIELKVDDSGIISHKLNSPPYLNKNKVPSHAITSQYLFGSLSKADIFKHALVNGAIPFYLRIYAGVMGTACLEGPIDNCLQEIFNKEVSDVVVPLISQRGGLEEKAITKLKGNLGHSKKNVWSGNHRCSGCIRRRGNGKAGSRIIATKSER